MRQGGIHTYMGYGDGIVILNRIAHDIAEILLIVVSNTIPSY
jgi:hypothetical protein